MPPKNLKNPASNTGKSKATTSKVFKAKSPPKKAAAKRKAPAKTPIPLPRPEEEGPTPPSSPFLNSSSDKQDKILNPHNSEEEEEESMSRRKRKTKKRRRRRRKKTMRMQLPLMRQLKHGISMQSITSATEMAFLLYQMSSLTHPPSWAGRAVQHLCTMGFFLSVMMKRRRWTTIISAVRGRAALPRSPPLASQFLRSSQLSMSLLAQQTFCSSFSIGSFACNSYQQG